MPKAPAAASPTRPDPLHPFVWLIAVVFGAGGAGTVWLSQKNELDHLHTVVAELESKKKELTESIGGLKTDLADAHSEGAAERAKFDTCEAKAKEQAAITVSGSQGTAIGHSSVTGGQPCPPPAGAPTPAPRPNR